MGFSKDFLSAHCGRFCSKGQGGYLTPVSVKGTIKSAFIYEDERMVYILYPYILKLSFFAYRHFN